MKEIQPLGWFVGFHIKAYDFIQIRMNCYRTNLINKQENRNGIRKHIKINHMHSYKILKFKIASSDL